jgi:hypothetical protein
VAIPKALKTLPYRILSIVVVFVVAFHYILPRIPSSPNCFLLLDALLLSKTTIQISS